MAATIAIPYSRLATDYDATIGIPFFHQTRDLFERLFRKYGIRFRSAADIGCGTGLFARYLKVSRDINVFAVDLSEPMLRVAQRNCRGTNVVLLRQDIRCLRLPHPVDLITANFDTLNHILSNQDLLRTLKRVAKNLNPGGHFIFDVVTNCLPFGSILRRGLITLVDASRNRFAWIRSESCCRSWYQLARRIWADQSLKDIASEFTHRKNLVGLCMKLDLLFAEYTTQQAWNGVLLPTASDRGGEDEMRSESRRQFGDSKTPEE